MTNTPEAPISAVVGQTIESMVRNYTAEQFALAWTLSYASNELTNIGDAMRYMRELSQGKTEEDYKLFKNGFSQEFGTDYQNMEIINECLKTCIKEYLFDYKLFWDVINRGMRRAYEKISKTVLQTNTTF